jgi:uncharacterized protein with PIN domain
VVALVTRERGWEAIHRLVGRADVYCVLPGSVLTEAVYVARRKGNSASGRQISDALAALGVATDPPAAPDLLRAAALIELSDANPGPPVAAGGAPATLSLGDALSLAVTERLGFPVVTRDAYWEWLVDQGHLAVKAVSF